MPIRVRSAAVCFVGPASEGQGDVYDSRGMVSQEDCVVDRVGIPVLVEEAVHAGERSAAVGAHLLLNLWRGFDRQRHRSVTIGEGLGREALLGQRAGTSPDGLRDCK